MKLSLICRQCLQTNVDQVHLLRAPIQDDARYEIICPYGHEDVTILRNQKFEILFNIGVNAILDGYYREAVSSFTASLERFYEFFIKVALFKGDNQLDSQNQMDKAWKLVNKQSERQLGAFVFLYLNEFGEPPLILPDNVVSFRNKVIHEGKIPSSGEAIDYGQTVFNLISPVLEKLKVKHEDSLRNVADLYWKKSVSAGDAHVNITGITTELSIETPPQPDYSLEKCIAVMKSSNRFLKIEGLDVQTKAKTK
ncbi:MAG: hypothetical protein ACAH83_17300 [Alphaproteobacteria bacterium]